MRPALLSMLLLSWTLLLAERPPEILGARRPCVTPDGAQLLFAWQGDIWSADLANGAARRVTLHPAHDDYPLVSSDGLWLVFASDRDGAPCLYKQPVAGGPAEQLTFYEADDVPQAISPDGQVLFVSRRGQHRNLYTVPLSGGTPQQLTWSGASFGVFTPDQSGLVFGRGTINPEALDFEGSGNFDLFQTELGGSRPPQQLTWSQGNDIAPVFDDSQRLYWASGAVLLSRADGGEAREEAHAPTAIRGLHARGAAVYIEAGFHLYRLEAGQLHPVQLFNHSDQKVVTNIVRQLTGSPEEPDIASDGSLVFSLEGSLWLSDGTGPARRLTQGSSDHWPRFAGADSVVFQSRRSGNQDLYIVSVRGGTPRALTSDPADDFYHCVTPDAKTVVFCSERSGNRDIWALNLRNAQLKRLTNNPAIEDDPAISPDGRLLAFDSDHHGNRDIWIVQPGAGTAPQCLARTPTTDQCPAFSPDGKRLAFERRQGNASNIWVHDLSTRKTAKVVEDGTLPRWSADARYLVYESTAEDGGLARIRVPEQIVEPEPLRVFAQEATTLPAFNALVLEDVFRTIETQFYDEDTHGVDWDEVRERYRPLVEQAETAPERTLWLNRMLGELRASHLGVRPPARRGPGVGELGARFNPAGSHLELTAVLERGPAERAGLQAGDLLLGIDGQAVHPHTNLWQLLHGKAQKEVELSIERAGTLLPIKLRTVTSSQLRTLEYQAWRRGRLRMVKQLAGERLGYIHLTAMDARNLERFKREIDELEAEEGLIIDVRNNGGGNIHEQLLQVLLLRPYGVSQTRGRNARERFETVLDRPFVVLVNERSFSDAEIFPHSVQTLGLAKVVGAPTSGSVIGTTSKTLADGSNMRIPRTGWFGLDGANLEGTGVTPDIIVSESEADRYYGRDPQLQVAVEQLLQDIESQRAPPGLRARMTRPSSGLRRGEF